jgi:hypothetical protein
VLNPSSFANPLRFGEAKKKEGAQSYEKNSQARLIFHQGLDN